MEKNIPITVAHGDGIGPEIMAACLHIMKQAGARIDFEEIEIGEKVYLKGITSGISKNDWEIIRKNKVFFKAPITTPQGGGYKSLNVTTRKTLGLYANIRPCVAYHPFVGTKHPGMDVVIVRENEEDTYAGIEHQQTKDVTQCLKLISRIGSAKIVREAFEYAKQNDRKKVTCFTKDNIMKITDGLFHKVFDEIAKSYPEIESEHWIVDIGAAKLAHTPENFDVVVMPNLYGDIISDITAQIAGSVGLAGSANIGDGYAMFEAIHGSAPRRAGQNLANPSGLLLGGIMMLVYLNQPDIAERVHNAWLKTLEDGVHTYDIFKEDISKEKVGTKEFANAVVSRLGKKPEKLKPVHYKKAQPRPKVIMKTLSKGPKNKLTVGVDVFVDYEKGTPEDLGQTLSALDGDGLKLKLITSRGVKIWPERFPETGLSDHFRCRFFAKNEGDPISHQQIVTLLDQITKANLDFIKIENLCVFDGEKGYSLGQGE